MKIFESFKRSKKLIEKTKFIEVYGFSYDEKEYRIITTKRCGNKHTVIHCIDDCIYWEQVPPFVRLSQMYGEKVSIYKFDNNKNIVTLFVIRGRPNGITGLDNGIFGSANRYDPDKINVMSWARFKAM